MTIAAMVVDWDEPTPGVKDAFAQLAPDDDATIIMDLRDGGAAPGFYFFRIVWTPPSGIVESLDTFRAEYPEIPIEVVDPYNFFALFKRHYEQSDR